MAAALETDSGDIRAWRSIVTLVVFVITNVIVLFPFHVPLYVPRVLCNAILRSLVYLRVIPPRPAQDEEKDGGSNWVTRNFMRFRFPLDFITAPVIADLFLLAISAIGRQEVHDGTVGTDHIQPYDIMIFFITLAYIAISIDASGLIRWLAFKVLGWGGEVGHKLFFYLYAFFFGLGTFIGNDPIILSGTAFLAYMTRVSKNIRHPKAWIYSQFAVANIASAILVSSNPTNLVLAGAFKIKFIVYTANMIVPVAVTAIVLFPFLLYIVFANEDLIPSSIERFTLPTESANRSPVNPNIPHASHAQGRVTEEGEETEDQTALASLEEILNPFLDRGGATFGGIIMAATLITVLALNAASQSSGAHPVFWVTLPAAFVMLCWDLTFGWLHRNETRAIAREGRRRVEEAQNRRELARAAAEKTAESKPGLFSDGIPLDELRGLNDPNQPPVPTVLVSDASAQAQPELSSSTSDQDNPSAKDDKPANREDSQQKPSSLAKATNEKPPKATLVSITNDALRWLQETFPTVAAVFTHLPIALIPFAFAMFVLVQALVSKGWVRVFAYGWNHWVNKTETIGAIGGMGFLSVILCNFAGTNIGTTILLSRVIQQWYQINEDAGIAISERTFWATVYSMALGVNYGAFSTAFSASLAGLLWRDILARKHIKVHALDFARVNFPIIAISMAVGSAVLIGEVYIMRDDTPYRQA